MLYFSFSGGIAPAEVYTLSLHDALPIYPDDAARRRRRLWRHEGGISVRIDRKSTRLNSSHVSSSYAVFCLKKKTGPATAINRRPTSIHWRRYGKRRRLAETHQRRRRTRQ